MDHALARQTCVSASLSSMLAISGAATQVLCIKAFGLSLSPGLWQSRGDVTEVEQAVITAMHTGWIAGDIEGPNKDQKMLRSITPKERPS